MTATSPDPEAPDALPRIKTGSRWRGPLVVCGLLALFLSAFYLEENWRGKRVWQKTRAELQAQKEDLDWFHYLTIPPSDDQNLLKAPGMDELFVRGRKTGVSVPNLPERNSRFGTNQAFLADVRIVLETDDLPEGEIVFDWSDLENSELRKDDFSRALWGKTLLAPQGMVLSERPAETKRIYIRAASVAKASQIESTFLKKLREPVIMTASEFVAWSESQSKVLARLDEAFKRPECWLEGGYANPWAAPSPNFVACRTVAQLLGSRAKAFILLNKPDEALRDLQRMEGVTRLLKMEPLTIVSSMLDVAVRGIISDVIADGFAENVWEERHWRAIKGVYEKLDLLKPLVHSMRSGERAGMIRLMEATPRAELPKVFGFDKPTDKYKWPPIVLRTMPQGWLDQNLSVYSELIQAQIQVVEGQKFFSPQSIDEQFQKLMDDAVRNSPMTIISRLGIPNFAKSMQIAVKNQSYVNEVLTACALEFYRKMAGEYPKSLETLVPALLPKTPIDLVGGKPLRYQKRSNGQYALYSIAWDGNDDMAKVLDRAEAPMREVLLSPAAKGDWVWRGVPERTKTSTTQAQK